MAGLQGGVTLVTPVLRSASAVKMPRPILTEIFIIALHCIGITFLDFSFDISLDLDQFYGKYQRGLTIDYGEYFDLAVDFCFDRGRRS